MDMRTPGKHYEEFYSKAREMGVHFINARPSEILEDPDTKELLISVEAGNQAMLVRSDLVILSNASIPSREANRLGQVLGVSRESGGFFMEAHPKLKPVDTTSGGIFIAGSAQGPKDIPYSVSQGLAAASRASRILCREEWAIEPIVAVVTPELCNSCGRCAKVCPYGAITVEENQPAVPNPALCQGCGNCAAECPQFAIDQHHFTNQQILGQIRAALKEDASIPPEKKVLTFACNFCSYGGSDTAGVARLLQKTNARVIRTMCSGRVNPRFVFEGFAQGAGAVLVTGCHIGDCHYVSANHQTEKRFSNLGGQIEKMGISPKRFRLEWISASEGEKWQRTINEMCTIVEELGVEKIASENEVARPQLLQKLRKFYEKVITEN